MASWEYGHLTNEYRWEWTSFAGDSEKRSLVAGEPDALEDKINALGREGWEMINVPQQAGERIFSKRRTD